MEKKVIKKKIKTGNVLIAEPFLEDPNFKKAVILVTDHVEKEGTVGFVINQKSEFLLSDLIEELSGFDFPVYQGGPVAIETLHFLHNVGDLVEGAIFICQGIYWGGDFDKLKFLIQSELIKEYNVRFFMGYSGWSPKQLRDEIKEGTWFVSEMDPNFLYKIKPENIWQTILDLKGNHFSVISQIDNDSILN